MKLSRLLLPVFATAAFTLALTCTTADAQTGPIGGGGQVKKDNQPPVQGVGITPERLESMLKAKGHQTKLQSFANGAKQLQAQIEKDGWRFQVEFDYGPNMQTMFMTAVLGAVPADVSAGQLLAVLDASYQKYPYHFAVRNQDRKLCMSGPTYLMTVMTEQQMEGFLDMHLAKVRETHSTWSFVR